jgi:hypothetical protein
MRGKTYRGIKMEYIKKDAIAHILAKMYRWNITIRDLELALQAMKEGRRGR